MQPNEESIPTPFGDLWFELGSDGRRYPIYSNELCHLAAIEAFFAGNYGALMVEEIGTMREAAKELGYRV